MIGRRDFITLLGGAAAWPVVARGQQGDRMRRIGVLMNTAPDHPEGKAHLAIFRQGLQALGWADGRNVRIEARGTSATVENFRKQAAELVAATPDVVLAITTNAVLELQKASRTVPIDAGRGGRRAGTWH